MSLDAQEESDLQRAMAASLEGILLPTVSELVSIPENAQGPSARDGHGRYRNLFASSTLRDGLPASDFFWVDANWLRQWITGEYLPPSSKSEDTLKEVCSGKRSSNRDPLVIQSDQPSSAGGTLQPGEEPPPECGKLDTDPKSSGKGGGDNFVQMREARRNDAPCVVGDDIRVEKVETVDSAGDGPAAELVGGGEGDDGTGSSKGDGGETALVLTHQEQNGTDALREGTHICNLESRASSTTAKKTEQQPGNNSGGDGGSSGPEKSRAMGDPEASAQISSKEDKAEESEGAYPVEYCEQIASLLPTPTNVPGGCNASDGGGGGSKAGAGVFSGPMRHLPLLCEHGGVHPTSVSRLKLVTRRVYLGLLGEGGMPPDHHLTATNYRCEQCIRNHIGQK